MERFMHGQSGTAAGPAATRNSTLIEEQLKDALEKNQQWLVYDQQREAYVQAVLVERYQLEQELNKATKALLQRDDEERRDVVPKQWYEKLVGELERERQKGQQLLTKHHQVMVELEKERLNAATHQKQIQLSSKDLDDMKHDNQHLQWQLHRVLKELRKATDKLAILESEKTQRKNDAELETVPKESQSFPSSPTRAHNLLDESFLECPNCRAQYPTSRLRDLLLHVDECCGTD